MSQEHLSCFNPVLLYSIVQCCLVLDILGIHRGPVGEEESNKVWRLNTGKNRLEYINLIYLSLRPIDKASASKMVWHLNIGTSFNQALYDIHVTKMSFNHEFN